MTQQPDGQLLEELLSGAEEARLRGQYREGRALAERAVTLAAGAGDDDRLALALRLVANQCIRLGEHEAAVRAATLAVAAAERRDDVHAIVDGLNLIAFAYLQLGLFDEAMSAIERSTALLPQVDDLDLRCATYNRAGTVRVSMNEFQRAAEMFERAERELRAAGGDASNETQFCLLNNMADAMAQAVQSGVGIAEPELRGAAAQAERAYALAVESGNPYRQCIAAHNWAVVENGLANPDAGRLLELSAQLARDNGYRSMELAVLEARAGDATAAGRFEEGVRWWNAVKELAGELLEWPVLARAYQQASRCYEGLGRLGDALSDYRRYHELEATRRTETAEVRSRLVGMSVELEQLRTEAAELGRHAHTDALTGLDNRRAFDAALPRLLETSAPESWVVVCLLDVDHFKRVNDGFGHAAGDDVLRALGRLLLADARRGDVVARIGGEELALVWVVDATGPAQVEDAVRSRVERVRGTVAAQPWGEVATGLAVTVSLGAVATRCEHRPLPPALLAAADELLYTAKRAGRDRACVRLLDAG